MPCGVGGGTHRSWPGGRGVREAGQGLRGGARASVSGVGGRDMGTRDGANFATCRIFVVSMMVCGVRGGVPTGAGLVDGGVDQGPWLQERVWGLVGCSKEEQVQEGVREGLAWRSGGVQGLRLRGGRW